jgi:Protein of unknown function (DUF1638)
MSNSPTGPTSTTGSSTNSVSEIVACGALAGHIRDIAARRGWQVAVRPLPARLHNRPEKIPGYTERTVATAQASGSRAIVAYADCGTYGALDKFDRLPGLHCYDLFAGPDLVSHLLAEEPGTYLLTDYLVRTFDRTVLASLGLDRHPELWNDYFGHYRRLVWLAQEPTPELATAAERISNLFGLPLTCINTGLSRLESVLAKALEGAADMRSVAHKPHLVRSVAHKPQSAGDGVGASLMAGTISVTGGESRD